MYDRILYPTDGSSGSKAAAAHVKQLASAFDATVHVLYVVDTTHPGGGMTGNPLAEEGSWFGGSGEESESGMVGDQSDGEKRREALAERAEAVVEEAASAFEGVESVTAVEYGTPHSAILEYADEHGVDLVVMGTHGRTGVERYLLGSVTEKVVRLADPPVVTVRADESE
ncbi:MULTISPECIES: universal stress protein [Halorubrum]|uniref:universal stress protein n=1 Tax=Halorubrum TaxID=56688 RepID=UPI000F8528BF|nr:MULTISPECIES: universal stress protein [Halorubrum]AZQ14381.1 universal stress protein [Halorubrum sp. PV6]